MINLSIPNLDKKEIEFVTNAIKTGWVSSKGEYVKLFEKKIANYLKIKGAISCQNGTSALHLALISLGIAFNDEVIVPALTFIASVNPVRYVGALPIFMDCDDSLCMDADKLESFIKNECYFDGIVLKNKLTNRKIKAIIVTHVFGNVPNIEKILKLSKFYNLKIIEDAAEALGTYYKKSKFAGTFGDVGIFSFNGNKIITTGGGGMVVSNNEEILEKIRYLSNQAKDDEIYFVHNEIGYNYRMTNVQAAIGIAQIEKLESFIKIKQKNYLLYKKNGINLLEFSDKIRSNKWFYSFICEKRDELIMYLKNNDIQSRPIWRLIHLQIPYKNFQKYKIEKAVYYMNKIINLPCSTNLKENEIKRVANLTNSFLSSNIN